MLADGGDRRLLQADSQAMGVANGAGGGVQEVLFKFGLL